MEVRALLEAEAEQVQRHKAVMLSNNRKTKRYLKKEIVFRFDSVHFYRRLGMQTKQGLLRKPQQQKMNSDFTHFTSIILK